MVGRSKHAVGEDPQPRRGTRKRNSVQGDLGAREGKRLVLSKVTKVYEAQVPREEDALAQTEAEGDLASTIKRRVLRDFRVEDSAGDLIPLETFEIHTDGVFFTGAVHPVSVADEKQIDRQLGRYVERVGPCTAWRIAGFNNSKKLKNKARILLETEKAQYYLDVPSPAYRKIFNPLLESGAICCEVYHALSPEHNGDMNESYNAIVAKIARAKLSCTGSANAMNAINLSGSIVKAQLRRLKPFRDLSSEDYENLPFIRELSNHMKSSNLNGVLMTQQHGRANQSIKISEHPGDKSDKKQSQSNGDNKQIELDIALAQRMQAEEEMKWLGGGRNARGKNESNDAYLRMAMRELADDYPVPTLYVQDREELDELVMVDSESIGADAMYLPRYTLSDFSVYNEDGFLTSLELLPLGDDVEADIEIFISGVMKEENEDDFTEGGISFTTPKNSSSGAGSAADEVEVPAQGIKIFSSEIRQVMINVFADMIFVSVRTMAATYKLVKPAQKYAGWFDTFVKVARLSVKTLGLVTAESRPSKISFDNVVRHLKSLDKFDDCFISKKEEKIERYLTVHGQVILSQLCSHPKEAVKKCALVSQVKGKMAACRHSKLYLSTKGQFARKSRNPMRHRTQSKPKQMRATTTKGVFHIWQSHFLSDPYLNAKEEEAANGDNNDIVDLFENEEAENLEDFGAELLLGMTAPQEKKQWWSDKIGNHGEKLAFTKWVGRPTASDSGTFHEEAVLGSVKVGINDAVVLKDEDEDSGFATGLIQALWEDVGKGRGKAVRVWKLVHGCETVLGETAGPYELFVVPECLEYDIDCIVGKVDVCEENVNFDLKSTTERIVNEGFQVYFYRKTWDPLNGMFSNLPDMCWGQPASPTSKQLEEKVAMNKIKATVKGTEYSVGDFVFVQSRAFTTGKGLSKKDKLWKGSSNYGLCAWHVCEILGFKASDKSVSVRRFYRPEDISKGMAYESPLWELYYSEDTGVIPAKDLCGKCHVQGDTPVGSDAYTFACKEAWNAKSKKKYKCPVSFTNKDITNDDEGDNVSRLATLDIFAGCGGLSEGMHQAKAIDSKWAIEFEEPAAKAFEINHEGAEVYTYNCNSILLSCMDKAGLREYASDSIDEEAEIQCSSIPKEKLEKLPVPGAVDFICGGPPCQGYSGMNRFNKGSWSRVQNEMVLAFLSYADLFRPKYFLLENVRNFVVHNKGQTFRLVIRTLLEMGYQVRFGVLNAGLYGVSQSRKRLFIWAAAPHCKLPDWPKPIHVFSCPQLGITLPSGDKYTAVSCASGAPLRSVTVRDTIGDLPVIENGSSDVERNYVGGPVSTFQKAIRGQCTVLQDHVCKEMNELNLQRCRLIPKNDPSADWRVLQQLVEEDPSREYFVDSAGKKHSLVPWCLPNTADRHNNWRGLYSRLDYDGHFPTAITDPSPMGKVGQVFHPEQDRIVSVRECARCQGFPDAFAFYGTVLNKHRQVGNAVPPPLAKALGHELKRATIASSREETANSRKGKK